MTRVILNGALVRSLIDLTFPDGAAGLQSRWDADGGLHRTTIYRWTKGQLPQSSRNLLRLAGLLDCDPIGLLDASSESVTTTMDRVLAAFQLGQLAPALQFLREFFGRQAAWPPMQLATDFFDRPWHTLDFVHDPAGGSNYYGLIEICGSLQQEPARPQVFHFAFRYPRLFDKRWLHYGFVTRLGPLTRLVHINGHVDRFMAENADEPTRVETFFGPSEIIFRVASLHPFTAQAHNPDASKHPCVRFPW